MADNVNITAGAGVVIATDEDASNYHYQKIKLADGTANSTTTVYVDIGAKANALRVAPASDITDGTYIGDIKFGEALATVTAITSLDKSVYVDDATWTDNTSSHTLVGGVYQSTDHTVTDGDVSPFQVDVNGCIVLGTGAKAIGKLAANTGVDIGDVDILSIAAGDNNIGNVDIVSGTVTTVSTVTNLSQMAGAAITMGEGGVGAGCQRVTLATDDDGVAHLNTIAGAVAATHMQCDIVAGTVTTVSTVTTLSQLGGQAISMGEGVVAAGCQRVTLATDDDGVAHLATIAADTNNIETAIQIMDDWDATHAGAASADGPQVMGAGYSTALPTDVGADADAARLVTDRYGRLCTGLQPQAAKATLDNADTTTAREVVAATATRRIFVTSLILSVDTAGNYWLEDGDATAVTGKFYLAANGGVAVTFPEGTPLNTVTQNKALNVKGSAAGNVSVTVTYYLAV